MCTDQDVVSFEIPYGEGSLSFELPRDNWLAPVRTGQLSTPIDVADEVRKGLRKPIGSRPLGERIRSGSRVAILCDDYTRPTPAHAIVPSILDELEASGAQPQNIEVIIAGGRHRPMTQEELSHKLGQEVLGRVRVSCHDAHDEEGLAYLGTTRYDVPVWVNRRAAEADILIGVGLVEVHPLAGFAGGPKILCPGAAGRRTINHTHGLGLRTGVSLAQKRGNAFWENSCAVADQVGLDLVVNVVLGSNDECVGAHVGRYVEAQQAAIETFLAANQIVFPCRPDIVVASANPKYHYLDQCLISFFSGAGIVKPAGTCIVAAACPEGLGHGRIGEVQTWSLSREWSSPGEYWVEAAGDECENSPDAMHVYWYLQLREQANLVFVSDGSPASELERSGFRVASGIQMALDEALLRAGPCARVAVVPLGGMAALKVRD